MHILGPKFAGLSLAELKCDAVEAVQEVAEARHDGAQGEVVREFGGAARGLQEHLVFGKACVVGHVPHCHVLEKRKQPGYLYHTLQGLSFNDLKLSNYIK